MDAFVAALQREGWQQPHPAAVQPADGMAGPDHDDPAAALRVMEALAKVAGRRHRSRR